MFFITKRIAELIFRSLFPRFCVGCCAEGELLCHHCSAKWTDIPVHMTGKRHVFSFAYADPFARSLICAWKYAYDTSAWDILQEKLQESVPVLQSFVRATQIEAISYVPLHPTKQHLRGFDQAQEIARWVATQVHLPLVSTLQRVKYTKPQARENTDRRRSFTKQKPFLFRSQEHVSKVLLVDDVWTTGSTMQTAARILRRNRIQSWFFTLAKG